MGLRGFGGLRTVKRRAPSTDDFTHTVAGASNLRDTTAQDFSTLNPTNPCKLNKTCNKVPSQYFTGGHTYRLIN